MEKTDEPFVVLIFPAEKDKATLAELAKRFLKNLTDACGGSEPVFIYPDATAICLLVHGDKKPISKALELSCAIDTRYLLLSVGKEYETYGLAKALGWLRKHN